MVILTNMHVFCPLNEDEVRVLTSALKDAITLQRDGWMAERILESLERVQEDLHTCESPSESAARE